jgi:hypothetical protein
MIAELDAVITVIPYDVRDFGIPGWECGAIRP